MSNIKDRRCNLRLQDLALVQWMAAMLRDVVRRRRRRRRRWAHAPVIHAASHFYHEKRVAWFSISMHACDPVPIVVGLSLAGAPLSTLYSGVIYKRREGLLETP